MLSLINQYEAVLDACVLVPMPICDTLLRLAEEPAVFIPRWSSQILGEVASTLGRMGYSRVQIERRIFAMRNAFEDAEVFGYECLIESMPNHAKDRHVLAAAVHCGANAIVTENVKHSPADQLQVYNLEALTTDQFLVHQ